MESQGMDTCPAVVVLESILGFQANQGLFLVQDVEYHDLSLGTFQYINTFVHGSSSLFINLSLKI